MTVLFLFIYSNLKYESCKLNCDEAVTDIQTQDTAQQIQLEPLVQPEVKTETSINTENIMLEMKRRELLVMDECHESGRFKVGHVLGNPKTLNVVSKMLIDRNYEVAWCPVYKAGSSTWLYVFAAMGEILTPINLHKLNTGKTQINELARKAYPKAPVTRERVELLSQITRFIIVRHPFERILSAYRDKLEHRKNREFYYKKYGYEIQQEPTFEEFLKFIVKTKKFDEHWRPFYIECAPCELNYQYILKMESLDTEQIYFATKFNLLQFLPNITNSNPVGRTHLDIAKNYYSQISKQLLGAVYLLYEMDFRLFDYSPQQYFDFARDGD
ncbi:hypothetical protein L9F63_001920 [Diploptera punctata]|uniref:Carbohydrate sulfotransferase n=1 Tax=Diploptera punctata TaxID=6984 RepID=A0AAD8EIM3_DIPPU|nr:hypothetical protein L9F63_001920 [Diploptera punctata]